MAVYISVFVLIRLYVNFKSCMYYCTNTATIPGVRDMGLARTSTEICEKFLYDRGRGELTLQKTGQDMLVVTSEIFRELILESEAVFSSGAAVIWYVIGEAAGRKFLYSFREKHKELRDKELMKELAAFFTQIGWGKISIPNLNLAKGEATVKIKNNPFTRKNPDKPICHLVRGLIAGLYEVILQKPTNCIETQCASAGSSYCEFHVKSQS